MNEKILRIASKIKLHDYKLNPVLSKQEIDQFEYENGIKLPDEYREFISHIGNGGDGPPYYGMYTLKHAFNQTKKANEGCSNLISLEFPLKECWVWEGEENWTEELREKCNNIFQGTLILGTDGCGIWWVLIVSGPLSGEVWNIEDIGAQPCAPRLSFLEWYEYWLDGGSDWWRDFKFELT